MTKIKICGMTCEEDIKAVNKYLPDYIGFVLFFPKSKRNISIKQAKELLAKADKRIKTVAVVVSPTIEQLLQIEEAGFDSIQIHGTMTKEVYEQCQLPILRAFNISNVEKLEEYEIKDKIKGYVFDSKNPGSGETFDWKLLAHIRQKQKTELFLAGGIDETNVKRAISEVDPDVIDLSSAVEKVSKDGAFCGKDPEKIKTIITIYGENKNRPIKNNINCLKRTKNTYEQNVDKSIFSNIFIYSVKSRKSDSLNICIFIVILKKSVPVINPAIYKIPRTLLPSIV